MDKVTSQNKHLIGFGIAILLFATFAVVISSYNKKDNNRILTEDEDTSFLVTSAIVARATLSGSDRNVKRSDLNNLRELAKRNYPETDWFGDASTVYYGETTETEKEQLLELSDGDYCASFHITSSREADSNVYKLANYEFAKKKCGEYLIFIKD